jgi:hypothetical protein
MKTIAPCPGMVTREPVDGLSLIVARNVRSRRAALKLRQVDVAERAGIARSMPSAIEGERLGGTLLWRGSVK